MSRVIPNNNGKVVKKNLKYQIDYLLNSKFDEKKCEPEFIAKVRMLNFVCIIGIFFLLLLGTVAFIQENYVLGGFDYFVATALISIIYLLRITHKYKILSLSGVALAWLLFVFLFATGGVNNTAHLWLYTFPLFAFFLLDSKMGTIVTLLLLGFTLLFYIFQDNFPTLTRYSFDFMVRFTPSLLVVFLYGYLFEKTKEKTYKIVKTKNEELGKSVNKLEDNKKELTKLHEQLEERVKERTSELNEANQKLLAEIDLKNKATKAAEAAVKMKTEFLAQMSHEIRTPINSILSYSQLLKEETIDKIPKELQFSFDMINSGGQRLIRTIDLILNMSEVQTGTYEKIVERTNIVSVILKPLVSEFQSAAKAKDITLSLSNKFEGEDQYFDVDVYTVTQIFANLIDNAIKYTNVGEIEIITYKTPKNHYCINVKDSGIGIGKNFQKTIFDPFTQEEQGYTRKFEGNGLGMALVKEYCQLNNIKIALISEKGEGTIFTLTIPKFKDPGMNLSNYSHSLTATKST